MEYRSSRHHYIPKFLSKGFCNKNGLLYIYDKKKDLILKSPRSPKSIFHEEDRNTVEIDSTTKSSILEDVLFQELDNQSAETVIRLQKLDIKKNKLLLDDEVARLQFFIINLFWRLPTTDYAAYDLMYRASKNEKNKFQNDLINDPSWQKILRSGLYKETIDQDQTEPNKPDEYFAYIAEFEQELFVIGDFPMLYKNRLSKFTDLVRMDFRMALTSNRIFSYSTEPLEKFKKSMFLRYNASIIDQSKQYIACGNLAVLQGSVEFYRILKEEKVEYNIKRELFLPQN